MMRIRLLPVLLLSLLPIVAISDDSVSVAYRIDTPPFSYRTNGGEYSGMLVQLCEEAVQRAGYRIRERIPVTSVDRFKTHSDLVCDPTTITQSRAENMEFSPIVFVANSSFISLKNTAVLTEKDIAKSPDCSSKRVRQPDRPLVGVGLAGSTTANVTLKRATEAKILGDTLDYGLCTVLFNNHNEGVEAICDGKISFYFGDMDILRAHLAIRDDCSASLRSGFFSYEPYALVIPSEDAAFRRRLVAAIYEIYADGTAVKAYYEAFPGQPMSGPLEMLFRINAIPEGQKSSSRNKPEEY